ncbi:DUF4153 domain-containing protein [Glycomyces xiaoerkulensis]|uniref:DUF4153 domain-containing protein n=1 Tax=Glycomyces xiaoerkulensis TaxID=2038139 RepID=UPI000C25D571|nr:DUF4153 domain-containing protein [Glycomyces xiaoerkulensis]
MTNSPDHSPTPKADEERPDDGEPEAAAVPEQPPEQVATHPFTGAVHVGPPPPTWDLTDRRWGEPDSGAPPVVVLLTVVVALFAGWAALHSEGVGIGLAATGIATVALPLAAAGRERLAARLPGAVLIGALWSVAAIRDAGWIVSLCAVTALLLTPLALAPQRRFTGTLAAVLGHLEGLPGAFRWANRGRRKDKRRDMGRKAWVVVITIGLLAVFGGLFAAADRNFAGLMFSLAPDADPAAFILRLMLAAALFPLVLLWVYTAVVRPDYDPEEPPRPRTVSRFEIGLPLGALNLLFAVFIAMQIRTYFGGTEYVMETAGLTFAEYARRGFWQLGVVAVLTLVVIAVAAALAPRRERGDRWAVRLLLGALCAMSLVVVASATYRMSVYFETFGLTRLRLWVFTVELWLAVLFVLVLVCCWKLRAGWLPRGILASGALVLLGLAAINPDAFIARYNVDRFEQTGKLDLGYLQDLSADAVPELMALPDEELACVMQGRDRRERPLSAWNRGYALASEREEDFAGASGGYCPAHVGPGYEEDRGSSSESDEAGEDAPVDYGFFHGDTCERLDTASADEMFGTSAGGDYGVEPDTAHQSGTELSGGQSPDGRLECGYFGTGDGYVIVELREWPGAERAADELDGRWGHYSGSDYEVADLGSETMDGFTAVFEGRSYREYAYAFAIDELTLEASIIGGRTDAEARAVCEDLTDQMFELYDELA